MTKEMAKVSQDLAATLVMASKDISFGDFITEMKRRNEKIGENPQSIHFGRPEKYHSKNWRERREKWHANVLHKQTVMSRMTMVGDLTIEEMSKKDKVFQECCQIVGLPTTRRQYSKWRRGYGGARTLLRGALQSRVGAALVALREHSEVLRDLRSKHQKFDLVDEIERKIICWKIDANDEGMKLDDLVSNLMESDAEFSLSEDSHDPIQEFAAWAILVEYDELCENLVKAEEKKVLLEKELEHQEEIQKRLITQARGGAA